MAIASEIIGKLGGSAGVEVTPVEGAASGGSGSSKVLATIDVPAGETWLVAAIGQKNAGTSLDSAQPEFHLGDIKMPTKGSYETCAIATIASGTISFSIRRNNIKGSDSFTGHVYTVKL